MSLDRRVVRVLRGLLVALFALLLVLQVFSLPGQFAHLAQESPAAAPWRWPLTALAVFWVLCLQVVVVSTWRLLGLVRDDRIFRPGALPWVDAMIAAVLAAWTVLLVVGGLAVARADDPGNALALLVVLLIGAVIGLLLVVMRGLLRDATVLRPDLEAVI
ncbi:DUF2975 domain-containing protein [Actinomycetospora sp. OC33-EN08]|uniref:DUF2975 domain-containing protein n=1 Tax=Actinomycetospora aurantiaca TaxID=3129233 RepID=A0ABU8ML61_9PSEU